MKTRQFWYPLPERLIAQHPAEKRGTERMMVLHRDTGVIEHRHIADIVEYIAANDLLVVNDTKVFPARLIGEWPDTRGAGIGRLGGRGGADHQHFDRAVRI